MPSTHGTWCVPDIPITESQHALQIKAGVAGAVARWQRSAQTWYSSGSQRRTRGGDQTASKQARNIMQHGAAAIAASTAASSTLGVHQLEIVPWRAAIARSAAATKSAAVSPSQPNGLA